MSFTRDRLYNGYLRRNMAVIVTTVKVREIVPHLFCLSLSDREEIEAKRETSGNYVAMQHLLSCLLRRESWPEDFITALEACEHTTMAAEIRREYDSLRGHNNPNPPSPSPPATVVTVHVHPAPPASPLLSSPEGGAQSAAPLSQAAAAPPEPAAQASLPPEATVQPEASYQATKAASSSEPVPEPPQVAPPPSTPPLSPVTSHHQATALLLPQRGIHAHQEPEENSETDLQDVSGDKGLIPDEASAGDSVMSGGNSEVTPDPGPPEQCEAAAPSLPDPAQTAILEVRASQSHTNPETVGSTLTTRTPDKPPVQDTIPPVDKVDAVVLQPKVKSKPTATQVTSPPPAGIDGMNVSVCDDKPGQLLSIQQNHDRPTLPACIAEEEPYSGDSERLEISSAAQYLESSAQVPVAAAACRGVTAASPPPCQENGIAAESLSGNEPEENHYESPGQSFSGEQEVRVNVVHVAEEASIQNQDGQSLRPQAQILNGQATKEPTSLSSTAAAADTVSNANSGENCHPSQSGPGDFAPELKVRGQQDPEKETPPSSLSPNTKHILTAAGVAAFAMLMAWRLKN